MEEVGQLDLSRIPQSLRTRIEARLSNTKSIVADFKVVIARYDKSMGKSSKRNVVTSAPRKVQWAFDAAEDLSKFQPRLSAQLQIVQIVLQMGVGKFFDVTSQSDRLLTGPRQDRLLENNQSTSRQLPNLWNRGLLDQDQMQDLATNITDLIYRRLLTTTSPAMATPGRAFTLPDGEPTMRSLQAHPEKLVLEYGTPGSKAVSSPSESTIPQNDHVLRQDHSVVQSRQAQQQGDIPLVNEINDHLHELNLHELSDAEVHSLNDLPLPQLLLEGPEGTSQDEPSHTTSASHQNHQFNNTSSRTRRRFRPKFSASGFVDPLSALSMATSILAVIDLASKLASQSNALYRDANRVPIEVETFSRRVTQYSQILSTVATTILNTMDDGGLRVQVGHLLRETFMAFEKATRVLEKHAFSGASKSVFAVMRSSSSWRRDREEIVRIMEEIEALKLSLVILLQSLQIMAQSRGTGVLLGKGVRCSKVWRWCLVDWGGRVLGRDD